MAVQIIPLDAEPTVRYFKQSGDVATTAQEWNTLTGMSASVKANTDYLVELFVAYESSASNVGLGLGVNGPASPVEVRGHNVTNGLEHATVGYDDDNAVIISSEFNSNANFAVGSFIFRNGANAGTLDGRGRCETSSGTTTFKIGSYMKITEIG